MGSLTRVNLSQAAKWTSLINKRHLSSPPSQDEALQLCIKIGTAIDRVEYMFTTEFEAEVDESESATLHQYYREAMIQGYNFAFEVK